MIDEKCSYCNNKADFIFLWERSFFHVCLEDLVWYTQFFKLPDGHPPVIIPIQFWVTNKYHWPDFCIKFSDGKEFIWGKTPEEYREWKDETNKLVPDMNIP